MLTRRELIKRGTRAGIAAALMPAACTMPAPEPEGVWVNDVHSQLNRTRVLSIDRPTNIESLQALVVQARNEGRRISIMGGRHAMGGQQFGSDTLLVDMDGMQGIHEFDAEKGEVEIITSGREVARLGAGARTTRVHIGRRGTAVEHEHPRQH